MGTLYVDGVSGITALIFAKYPQAKTVKTRMVPPLTWEEAADLHRALLIATCEVVAEFEEVTVVVAVTPDERLADLRKMVGGHVHHCWEQGAGDLGRRLQRAADRAMTAGADGVILLGADSPTLPGDYLRRAIDELGTHDAVLGPCLDGGYYLLGLRRPSPELFRSIDWGSATVADQTRERAVSAGINCPLLPFWYDIDRFADLIPAARDLAGMTSPGRPGMIALLRLIESYIKPAFPRSIDGRGMTRTD